jgi:hypothetical protein
VVFDLVLTCARSWPAPPVLARSPGPGPLTRSWPAHPILARSPDPGLRAPEMSSSIRPAVQRRRVVCRPRVARFSPAQSGETAVTRRTRRGVPEPVVRGTPLGNRTGGGWFGRRDRPYRVRESDRAVQPTGRGVRSRTVTVPTAMSRLSSPESTIRTSATPSCRPSRRTLPVARTGPTRPGAR